ncbi:hypothetical protein D3C78_814280 [compost metagenome]
MHQAAVDLHFQQPHPPLQYTYIQGAPHDLPLSPDPELANELDCRHGQKHSFHQNDRSFRVFPIPARKNAVLLHADPKSKCSGSNIFHFQWYDTASSMPAQFPDDRHSRSAYQAHYRTRCRYSRQIGTQHRAVFFYLLLCNKLRPPRSYDLHNTTHDILQDLSNAFPAP